MSELQTALEAAFEDAGYEVVTVSENRGQIRVQLLDETAAAEELRPILYDTVSESEVMGLNVTSESIEGGNEMVTVVAFRRRDG
jgi:hypothetical protein